jgi:hypothetical protein
MGSMNTMERQYAREAAIEERMREALLGGWFSNGRWWARGPALYRTGYDNPILVYGAGERIVAVSEFIYGPGISTLQVRLRDVSGWERDVSIQIENYDDR